MARLATSIPATGTSITGGAAQTYTFATACGPAWVFIKPTCGDIIYGLWNDDASSPTVRAAIADFVLSADGIQEANTEGDRWKGMLIKTVGLYSVTDSVLNDDYHVRGIPYRVDVPLK